MGGTERSKSASSSSLRSPQHPLKFRPTTHSARSVTLGVLNAQSIRNKSIAINNCMLDSHLDIFAVVETWHDDANSPCLIACTPPNYKYIERARPRTARADVSMRCNHGGICVFFKANLHVSVISLPDYNSMEVLALYVHNSVLSAAIVTIYRPGSAPVTNLFFEELADVLECCATYANCIIIGDINVHIDSVRSVATQRLQHLLDSFGIADRVQQPTHRLGHQLDVFITRCDKPLPVIRVDPPIMSDHSLLIAKYNVTPSPAPVCPRVCRRKWRSFNIDNFTQDLMSSELLNNQSDDVNALFNCYNNTLAALLDKHAPTVVVTRYARPSSPWFDTECHLIKVKTRKLEKQYRAHPNSSTESAWRLQFLQQRTIFQSKFSSYWKSAIDSCSGNSKALWSKLRCLLQSPSDDLSTGDNSADDFADYFASKIASIRQTTALSPPPTITGRVVAEQLDTFRPVTSEEVMLLLNRSPNKQCVLDPIPTWLLKNVSSIISPVIASMCNQSFTQCTFPDLHKKAIVRPLLKKPTLDPSDLNSYRPISNLSFVSKTLERLVCSRFVEHTDKHHLLSVSQSAYRANYSTETMLVRLHNDIVTAIDHGDVGALVLLDMSSAFDTVDHSIIADVLHERFGFEGDALSWMVSYLQNRSQVVSVGATSSTARRLPCGVPQGSVLGPKQFIAYTDEVGDIFNSHSVSYYAYADDSQGLKFSDTLNARHVVTSLERSVVDVGSWCGSMRLQLNAAKTELIWFGTAGNLQRLNPQDMHMHLGTETIRPSDIVRDLGVYFDSRLTMHDHVSRLTRTCFYHLRRIRCIRRQLSRDVTQRLVSAFVLSRLDYCNALLAELPASTLAPLQRVQNAAARLVLNLKPYDHITPALVELHWLPIKQRIAYKLCLLVHKSVTGQAPAYLCELLHSVSDIAARSSLRSAATSDMEVPRTRLRLGERAFSVAGVRQWNNLPVELRAIANTATFKSHLKAHFFRVAFTL